MLLRLPLHAEGTNEGALTKVLGLLLHNVLFTLGKAAELEDEAAGRGTGVQLPSARTLIQATSAWGAPVTMFMN